MKVKKIFFTAAIVLFTSCVCFAQTQSGKISAADIEPFVGSWTGQYQECTGSADCEDRKVDMTVTTEKVTYNLGPKSGGFDRHTKSSAGPVSKSYPAKYEKVRGVTTLSITQSSGMIISFTFKSGKLAGQGTDGRFETSWTLTKTGK